MSAEAVTLMNTRGLARVLVTVACGFVCMAAVVTAQEPAANLEQLKARYESHLNLVRRPLTELGTKYEQALIDLQKDLQKQADLDGLVAIKEELARHKKSATPAGELSKIKPLARLQKIYAAGYARARGELKDELTASHAAYRSQLERLMLRLTTAGEVEEAVKVRIALKQLGTDPEGKPTLKTGLVLHLQFESEKGALVRDASGSGNHATLVGDATNHATGENRRSYAVLDGRGDYIECAHDDSLNLTTDGSISVWVRPKRLQSMRGLVSKYNPTKAYTMRTWEDGKHRRVAFGGTTDNFVSKAELRENRWTHVVMTLDDGTVRFYFDGKLDAEGRRSGPLTTNTDPVRIGNDYDGRYFHGAVDDVRIYNRPLSAREVEEIYRIES